MSPPHHRPIDPDRPDSDVNIPKTMKKTAVTWIITGVLAVTCYAFIALGDSHYQTKEQAKIDKEVADRRVESLTAQVKTLQESVDKLERKIDYLQYTVEFQQSHDKTQSPKQKEQNP